MDLSPISFSKKEKRTVILAVTIGNLLEWYEIYLYVYWAPIISHLFFRVNHERDPLINAFLVFAVGFLARPIGGIFFGRIGDSIGRRKAFLLSLGMMVVPTFITGFLPTYAQVGHLAPLLLCFMRFMQSFPAGGELPGAFCYLYESSEYEKRRYTSSWASVGYQVGILVSTIECYFLEKFLPADDLISWGWRVSFFIGGAIGIFGLCLRYRLHETPVYREMIKHEQIVKQPVLKVIGHYKKEILRGVFYCALNSSSFYLISVNLSAFFSGILGAQHLNPLLFTALFLLFITIPLPLFGKLGDKYSNKKMLVFSTIGIISLLYPLNIALQINSLTLAVFVVVLFGLFFTCITSLIPYIYCELFPPFARFTCVGMSFNIADSIIGGFTPVAALYLYHLTGCRTSFCWILLFVSLLSLYSYFQMQEKPPDQEIS